MNILDKKGKTILNRFHEMQIADLLVFSDT